MYVFFYFIYTCVIHFFTKYVFKEKSDYYLLQLCLCECFGFFFLKYNAFIRVLQFSFNVPIVLWIYLVYIYNPWRVTLKKMLIKTAFSTKKQDLFSDHIKEKVLIAKKKDLFGGSTLKKSRLDKNRIYIHKNSFYHNFFFCARAKKRKEKKSFSSNRHFSSSFLGQKC